MTADTVPRTNTVMLPAGPWRAVNLMRRWEDDTHRPPTLDVLLGFGVEVDTLARLQTAGYVAAFYRARPGQAARAVVLDPDNYRPDVTAVKLTLAGRHWWRHNPYQATLLSARYRANKYLRDLVRAGLAYPDAVEGLAEAGYATVDDDFAGPVPRPSAADLRAPDYARGAARCRRWRLHATVRGRRILAAD
jgi:hypothetical protein